VEEGGEVVELAVAKGVRGYGDCIVFAGKENVS
jgi:hypothetical protein